MIAQQSRRACLLAATLLSFGSLALAQTNEAPRSLKPVSIDTGFVANNGTETEPVAVLYVDEPGTPWMRVSFDQVQLAGDLEEGNASYIKITSLKDGYFQYLNAETMGQWSNESAYFNGSSLQIELFASPGTGANRLSVNQLTLGALPPPDTETQCGSTDDRLPSNDPRSARILPVGCTGFIIDDDCGCFLTAGHCTFATQTVQFNVPPSNSNGSLNNPPPSDQYSVDQSSLQSNGGQGVGNDWGYFGVFPNSTTGMMPVTVQGSYTFQVPPPFNPGLNVRITGYGTDGGVRNQVQQTHVGSWETYNGGTALDYRADTTGGNSGSPVIQEEAGVAMGIHTHGGCTTNGGANHGTAGNHSGLQAALANPMGVCLKVTPPMCPTVPVANVDNGSGVNPLCLTNLTPPALGTDWNLSVDTSVVAGGNFSGIRIQGTGAPVLREFGEVLLDLSTPVVRQLTQSGTGSQIFTIALPTSVSLAGFSASVQGFVGVNSGVTQVCNAIQFVLGCEQ